MTETIKFISPEDCYPVRLEVLRKGLPLETAKYPKDYLVGSFHLGYFVGDTLAGIISCCEKNFKPYQDKPAFQVRGMAVLEEYRGKSIGEKLFKRAEEISKVFNKEVLWCNSRVSAVGFYEKMGLEKMGEQIEFPHAGMHYAMYKIL